MICDISKSNDILKRIENTIQFRQKEFSESTIEVGENVSIEELNIFKLDTANYIIPKQEKKVKTMSGFNGYVTFIDTEWMHQI